ncbi:MAG: Asp-tRNA(Asn)/Glu-tRNA(Gln) amidotransferase subunit GatA, partial [Rudanella sp.]|nr:Asp-tRNA(Asn)/Glu-tRNA(Gln) amidotransferase subunit GatA [Rudanella sp.]
MTALYRNFSAVRTDLRTGNVSCRQLVDGYLTRIQDNEHLNVFTEVYADEARQRADELDSRMGANQPVGRLAGMVIGLKDVLNYAGHGVRAGSRILDGFVAQFTATAVQRLLDEDVIVIGRQNCDEFAMGSSNEISAFGGVLNAADTNRVPGGSSGGSAVAVQAGLCLASIGSDTGGSVRQPAAFCGVTGLKPTYGRISRWGLIAYASSFDCIGPIANTPADCALLLEIMAGPDEFDSTVSNQPVESYSTATLPADRPLRIAYLRDGVE